jgi:hypothetical protein
MGELMAWDHFSSLQAASRLQDGILGELSGELVTFVMSSETVPE